MVKIRQVVLIEAINKALAVEMYYEGNNMVSVTLSYSLVDKVEALVKWSDLWNCLFLPFGKEIIIPSSSLTSSLRRVSHSHRSDQIALYFEPYDKNNVILIKWKDLKEALLHLKRQWIRDRYST